MVDNDRPQVQILWIMGCPVVFLDVDAVIRQYGRAAVLALASQAFPGNCLHVARCAFCSGMTARWAHVESPRPWEMSWPGLPDQESDRIRIVAFPTCDRCVMLITKPARVNDQSDHASRACQEIERMMEAARGVVGFVRKEA